MPVCYQDYPQTTGVKVSVETILKLTAELPQIVMLKHEDWPGLAKLSAVRAGSGTEAVPPDLDPHRQFRALPAAGDGARGGTGR